MEEVVDDTVQEQNVADNSNRQIAPYYQQVNHGVIEVFRFEAERKRADFQKVFHNERNHEFLAMDPNGILLLKPQSPNKPIQRIARYPKYEYSLLSQLIYYRKYNVYFALNKQSSLLVLNRNFEEMVPVSYEQRNVLAMILDKARDQLITNGVFGTKFWDFQPKAEKHLILGKAMSNYELKLVEHIESLGGSWVKFVDIDYTHSHLYYCSETDVRCYSLSGYNRAGLLFQLDGCHRMEITGCLFSNTQQILVTCSMDTEVKLWNTQHGYLAALMGHSQGITGMHFYPNDESRVITASIDGSVRIWSLGLQECQLTVQALQSEPVLWSGIVLPRQMFVASKRQFAVLQISYLPVFWSECRSQVTRLSLVGANSGKSVRVLALCEDSSVRIYSRKEGHLLSSLLSPPDVSALGRVLDVCHSRTSGLTFVLLDPAQLWVYFSKSNPACRLHAWSMEQLHNSLRAFQASALAAAAQSVKTQELLKSQRVCDLYWGPRAAPQCLRIALIRCPVVRWSLATRDFECPLAEEFVLLGLSDGRVLFLDPASPGGRLHLQLQAHRGPVTRLQWDPEHECLITGTEHKGVLTMIVWSLPDLRQASEVRLPADCQCLVRCGSALVSGHTSGHVIRSRVATGDRPSAVQRGLSRADLDAELPSPEHAAPVVAVDSLAGRDLLVTADSAGHVKVWQGPEAGQLALLVEISLTERVTCAGFLNPAGDLLVSMRRHLFSVPHRRYLPHVLWADLEATADDDESRAESAVLEDPAVVREGIQEDPNPVDYETYLAPFSVKLIKEYLATSDTVPGDLLTAREAEELEEERKKADAEATAVEGSFIDGGASESDSCCTLTGFLDSTTADDDGNDISEFGVEQLIELTQSVTGSDRSQFLHRHECQLPQFGESPSALSQAEAEEPSQPLQPAEPPPLTPTPPSWPPPTTPAAPAPLSSSQQQQLRQRQPDQKQHLQPASTKPAVQRPPPPPSIPPPLPPPPPRQPLTPAAVSPGSGLPTEAKRRQSQPPPAKKVKKQPPQRRQRNAISTPSSAQKQTEETTETKPGATAVKSNKSIAEFSGPDHSEIPESHKSVKSAMSQQQQPPQHRPPTRSLVVEIPSLPILTRADADDDKDGAEPKKRTAVAVYKKPRAVLLFGSTDAESAAAAPLAHVGSSTFPEAVREVGETTFAASSSSASAVTAAAAPVRLFDREASSASIDVETAARARLSSAKSSRDGGDAAAVEVLARGHSDLREQRQELEALRSEYSRLADKLAADFGTEDKPLRNYGLKRLTPDELINLNNLKRLQRGLREQGALQRKAELRLQRLAAWEGRANHGDCVAGPVPADTRPPPRMRTPSSRCSQRSASSAASAASPLRSQSAIEFRSAFQASREATEVARGGTSASALSSASASALAAASEKRRPKFGALPQTAYRLPNPATSATPSPRNGSSGGVGAALSHPLSSMRLRHGAASIPSRQYTYVLMRPGVPDLLEAEPPVASLAEERLIRQRFPARVPEWVGPQGVFEPKSWSYSIGGFHQRN